MPLFSVIVPVYKVEKYLDECVQSILQQSFRDFELILVDDGSPDNCPFMCDQYARTDNRVVVLHKENGGASSARNFGLEHANGEYVLFVDSDDRYVNMDGFFALAERINKFHEDVIQIACEDLLVAQTQERRLSRGNYDTAIVDKGNKNDTIDFLYKTGNFAGAAWLMCVKRKLLQKNDILFPIGLTAEDYSWILKVSYFANSYGVLNELVYLYRKGGAESVTSKARVSGVMGIHYALEFWKTKDDWSQGANEFAAYIYLIMLWNYVSLPIFEQQIVMTILETDKEVLQKTKSLKYRLINKLIYFLGLSSVINLFKIIKHVK